MEHLEQNTTMLHAALFVSNNDIYSKRQFSLVPFVTFFSAGFTKMCGSAAGSCSFESPASQSETFKVFNVTYSTDHVVLLSGLSLESHVADNM